MAPWLKPWWSSDNGKTALRLYQGHVLEVLKAMPAESVQCVVTSPPYWGLRDYKLEPQVWPDGWRGSLGLEPTLDLYIQHIVEVFREVRRVLRRDGTLWLNMGDRYTSGNRSTYQSGASDNKGHLVQNDQSRPATPVSLNPKDLLGVPWRVAFALRADGWRLRSDVIWAKPNPMPESVTDRPTKAHEYLFLLAKAERYFYDADAIREPHTAANIQRANSSVGDRDGKQFAKQGLHDFLNPMGRNKRTVWEIPTEAYPEAHFATFPQKLVEPCVLAGTSAEGCCSECGAPWKRVVRAEGGTIGSGWHGHERRSHPRAAQDDEPVHRDVPPV